MRIVYLFITCGETDGSAKEVEVGGNDLEVGLVSYLVFKEEETIPSTTSWKKIFSHREAIFFALLLS